MSAITNKDIMTSLGRIEEKVDNVTRLAEKTNGRVTTIENWKNGLEAIENWKREHPLVVNNGNGSVTWQIRGDQGQVKIAAMPAGV